MRKLLVFQHVPFEPLGTLDEQFKDAGLRVRYVNFDRFADARVDVSRYHGLVVLGGPMSADETDTYPHLDYECEQIAQAARRGMPVLGICLGAQLIARSFGAATLRGRAPEFGWTRVTPTPIGRDDTLIGAFDGAEWIYQWHADTFTLPQRARLLATSSSCLHQAFSIDEHVYGLQFHLEADRSLIRRWISRSRRRTDLGRLGVVIDEAALLRDTTRHLPRAKTLAESVFGAYIERFFNLRRRRAQPSR